MPASADDQGAAMSPKPPPQDASPYLPPVRDLATLAAAAKSCQGCELHQEGTQTVFGAGPTGARVVLVGEQPGHEEDLAGAPFVGPAGRVLTEVLLAAGIAPDEVWVTNAVKHFHWEPRGKRRLHKKPSTRHVVACRPWLLAELQAIRPEFLVCLGATAAQAVFGRPVVLAGLRGRVVESPLCSRTVVTLHPSAVLRGPDSAARAALRAGLIDDLKQVRKAP